MKVKGEHESLQQKTISSFQGFQGETFPRNLAVRSFSVLCYTPRISPFREKCVFSSIGNQTFAFSNSCPVVPFVGTPISDPWKGKGFEENFS
ncbi:hypothetical protein CEXT_309191 [Caerostris extrusa]|uniref:Uncharacterized protein n=1 Tax=Caerostris extrusa TaxID=172846 RepID=A0AAV4V5A8_CAEEX|nr:hypothetical protein CEXT_309191 [Caerostris extrusa]